MGRAPQPSAACVRAFQQHGRHAPRAHLHLMGVATHRIWEPMHEPAPVLMYSRPWARTSRLRSLACMCHHALRPTGMPRSRHQPPACRRCLTACARRYTHAPGRTSTAGAGATSTPRWHSLCAHAHYTCAHLGLHLQQRKTTWPAALPACADLPWRVEPLQTLGRLAQNNICCKTEATETSNRMQLARSPRRGEGALSARPVRVSAAGGAQTPAYASSYAANLNLASPQPTPCW